VEKRAAEFAEYIADAIMERVKSKILNEITTHVEVTLTPRER